MNFDAVIIGVLIFSFAAVALAIARVCVTFDRRIDEKFHYVPAHLRKPHALTHFGKRPWTNNPDLYLERRKQAISILFIIAFVIVVDLAVLASVSKILF